MLISIPTRSTINEYKNLKTSQKEVSINSTSKNLNEYVYDKAHKFNNAKIFGILALADIALAVVARKAKWAQDSLFMLGLANAVGIWFALDNNTNKKYVLRTTDEKLKMYRQSGINAIV